MSQRLNDIDIFREGPRFAPSPHPLAGKFQGATANPTSAPVRTKAYSLDGHVGVGVHRPAITLRQPTSPSPVGPSGSVPVVVRGTAIQPPETYASANQPGLFPTTNPSSLNPIPGVPPGDGSSLSNIALLTSMVYHMDRLDNPDINPKPGTIDGIRRNDELHMFVARYFDNYTAALRPGVVGKQLAVGPKSLNGDLCPFTMLTYYLAVSLTGSLMAPNLLLGAEGPMKTNGSLLRLSFNHGPPSDFDKYPPLVGH